MDRLEAIVRDLTYLLDSKANRHILGGALISMSLLFGGLAITVLTIKNEEKKNEHYIE